MICRTGSWCPIQTPPLQSSHLQQTESAQFNSRGRNIKKLQNLGLTDISNKFDKSMLQFWQILCKLQLDLKYTAYLLSEGVTRQIRIKMSGIPSIHHICVLEWIMDIWPFATVRKFIPTFVTKAHRSPIWHPVPTDQNQYLLYLQNTYIYISRFAIYMMIYDMISSLYLHNANLTNIEQK